MYMNQPFNREQWHENNPMDYFKAVEIIISCKDDTQRNEAFSVIYQITRLHIPNVLFKYYSLSNDEELNKKKIQTLKDQQVFNALFQDMNDPFDGKAYFYRHEAIKKYIRNDEELNKPIHFSSFGRVSSFSEIGVNSMPMWAHYGANHRGYAVTYDMKDSRNTKLSSCMFPVQYSDKRIDITTLVEDQFQAALTALESTMQRGEKKIVLHNLSLVYCSALFGNIKHQSWSYEKEFRNIVGKELVTTPAIPKEIYIGAKCSDIHTKELIRVGRKLNIPVFRMILDEYTPEYCLTPQHIQ